jgi:hypothetical protein
MVVPYGGAAPPFQFAGNPCLVDFLASASRPWRKSMTSPTDARPSPDEETHTGHSKLAGAIERGIFASRWLLAPLYLGLAVSAEDGGAGTPHKHRRCQ